MAALYILAVLLVVMGWGFAAIVRRPAILRPVASPFGIGVPVGCFLLTLLGFGLTILGFTQGEQPNTAVQSAMLGSVLTLGLGAIVAWPAVLNAEPANARAGDRGLWLLLAGALGWSLVWLVAIEHSNFVKVSEDFALKDVSAARPYEYAFVTCLVIVIAIVEEILFRGALQTILLGAVKNSWAAIVGSSFLWALAHAGYVEPYGLKEFQILVLGLAIGWAYERYGLRGAMAIHAGNNLMSMLLGIFWPV